MKLIIALILISFGAAAQKQEVKSDTIRTEIVLTDFQFEQLTAVTEQMKPLREKESLLISIILDASGKTKDRNIIGFFYDEKNKKFLIATTKK